VSALGDRVAAILASPRVSVRGAPGEGAPLERAPADLATLHAAADGLELDDGTRILARAEVPAATAWLVDEKALSWEDDLWVVGERDDLVLVLDLDARGARAGGGLLEAATDGLEAFRRVALGVVEYLEARLGIADGSPIAPERAAREAIALRDGDALEAAIARGFYPGADRELGHAAMSLGAIRSASGDRERAIAAFERAAAARARAVPRGAELAETAAAWRAFAVAAESAGAPEVAEICRRRAEPGGR
jgi:tetratricopeptide (TPR) repeat protein